ncbi:N-acetyltransferase [Arthrobacter sp. NicSoilB4]|uniref:GNAT family N-acetyltransferase n=1 Tax=Arthrobacter sp. NicSoilB4 TaxID=2830997 RepID=UPI001CC77BCA|nr:GNAT family N-acetyltransferase [Arthrobacter sp. NicSoilB4]BCW67280.1 N-acetyltransferase [Arthrobacter sp. NicSoilB4]
MIRIDRDDPGRAAVRQLLSEHLADMFATSPAESVHALDAAALSGPDITFWSAREDSEVLGCGALKLLQPGEAGTLQGEIKSMRTAAHARGRGIGARLLAHIMAAARQGGYDRLYLETGSQDFFAPARRLYQRHGFSVCPPFAGYGDDPNSVYMTLALDPDRT